MRAEALIKGHLARVVPEELIDDHYRALWGLMHGLSGLVVERVFRRVETESERVEVALRALDLHIATMVQAARVR